jgi:ABC-type transport system involved in multi-copper enzyme maturation permease subunit
MAYPGFLIGQRTHHVILLTLAYLLSAIAITQTHVLLLLLLLLLLLACFGCCCCEFSRRWN